MQQQQVSLILSLLFLQTLSSVAEPICENQSYCSATPHVTGPRGQLYKTLVAADGGGSRGLISVLLLVELEDAIKRYILIEKPDWLPKEEEISSVDDFEVSLADFIDCFAGTSAGGWTALYLASKGGNGASTDALNEKRIIEKYGLITPSSAKALVVFFNEFVSQMFPPYWNESPPQNEGEVDPASPGIMTPLLKDTVFVKTFNTWFGNTTLSELHTSCMVTAFDLIRRSRVLFVHDQLSPESNTGFTEVIRRRQPRSRNETFFADIKGHFGLDFYLRDLAYGGSTGLAVTPSREVYSLSGSRERLLPVDGNCYSTSPTLPALVQIANSTGDTTFMSDIQGNYGVDYFISDVAIASSTAPSFLPAHEVLPTKGEAERFLLSDGGYYRADPSLLAFTQIVNSTRASSYSDIAILSITGGSALRNLSSSANGGADQWNAGLQREFFALIEMTETSNKQFDLLFHSDPQVKAGQYLRVQLYGQPGTELHQIISGGFLSTDLPELSTVGRHLAEAYQSSIDSFVENFIFG